MVEQTDSPAGPLPILARMIATGISEDKARGYLRTQWVRSGEEIITDPEAVVVKYVLKPPPITEHE